MHRQMQEQNCFQLPPALTVVFILGGQEWQERKNGEHMIFFYFIHLVQNNQTKPTQKTKINPAGSNYFP